jgi:ABC-type branched-subunit amino acid transport system permease subunit
MINPYWELVILLGLINIIFAVSLNLVLGYNGQFSLGHAGFLAIGAYSSGVITTQLLHLSAGEPQLWHLLAGIAAALLLSITGAIIIGYPCLRLRGDYLAIATLGFAEIIRIVLLALPKQVFGGPTGMKDVPGFNKYLDLPASLNGVGNLLATVAFSIAGMVLLAWCAWALAGYVARLITRRFRWPHWRWVALSLEAAGLVIAGRLLSHRFLAVFQYSETLTKRSFASSQWLLFLLFIALVTLVTWLCRNYLNSTVGRAVIAIREDEIAATNLGLNCTWLKLQNFMLGSALAGLAGAMLAHTVTLYRPLDFNFFKSVDVLLMVVLGGMGSLTGSFVGAGIITFLLELLRCLGQWRMVIYSLLLVLFMIFRPGGLFGQRELGGLLPWRRLLPGRAGPPGGRRA